MVQTRCRWPILGNEPLWVRITAQRVPNIPRGFFLHRLQKHYFNEACTFLPYSRALARISFSRRVSRLWSRILILPPMMTVWTSLAFSAKPSWEYTSYIGTAY